ncbi:hypothetical protein J7M28_04060 [bacterium]|nr:hypothetical protein [bacterium]
MTQLGIACYRASGWRGASKWINIEPFWGMKLSAVSCPNMRRVGNMAGIRLI